MIASFAYRSPSKHAVTVSLLWKGEQRFASVAFPHEIQAELDLQNLPGGGLMTLASALSFAVFVALSSDRPVNITGDSSVWDPKWGSLQMIQ